MIITLKLNKRHTFTRRIGNDYIGKFTEWLSKNHLPIPEAYQSKITFTFLNRAKYKRAILSLKKFLV